MQPQARRVRGSNHKPRMDRHRPLSSGGIKLGKDSDSFKTWNWHPQASGGGKGKGRSVCGVRGGEEERGWEGRKGWEVGGGERRGGGEGEEVERREGGRRGRTG